MFTSVTKGKFLILAIAVFLIHNILCSQASPNFTVGKNTKVISNQEGYSGFISRFLMEDLNRVFENSDNSQTINHIVLRVAGETSNLSIRSQLKKIDSGLEGKWEVFNYKTLKIKGADYLVITGSDNRGLAYGVFNLSQKIGVSPWHFWADVPAKKRTEPLAVSDTLSQSPSVKYRGVFLNDEDWGLQPWAAKTFETDIKDIGPKTYAKIFELLLRLKANLIWPAMHPSTKAFYHYPQNKEMAQKYNVIIGTSHAEPLMRNNVDEWDSETMGAFNFTTNKDRILNYWSERIDEVKSFENLYTLGMRGKHDSGMEGVKSDAEAVELTKRILEQQRQMLVNVLGRPIVEIPQVLTLYKEVLDLYKKGLKVPEDITLIWPDDNYGYIKSLHTNLEQERPGGSGVYYHASYWGRPHDYLWIGSTNPSLMHFEMKKAYEMGVDQVWVVNVGDIKPIEYPTQLFLDMAYNMKPFLTNDAVSSHLENWTDVNLGDKDLAKILWKNYELAFKRKPEFMGWSQTEPTRPTHPTTLTLDEIDRRLVSFQTLEQQVEDKWPRDKDMNSAYFQLVAYPVLAASKMNQKFLYLDKYYTEAPEKRSDENEYFQKALNAYQEIVQLTQQYNQEISGGKWNHMMSMEPRGLPVFSSPMDLKNVEQKTNLTAIQPFLTIAAGNFQRIEKTAEAYWERIKKPSFSGNALVSKPFKTTASITDNNFSVVEYDFEVTENASYELQLQALPLHPLNLKSGQKVKVQIDNGEFQIVDFQTFGRSEEWKQNVLSNKTIKKLQPVALDKGHHTIKLQMIDAGVLIDYLFLYKK
ncbi:glycosyl hydrolase 115 family protein [Cytophaga sp. FL35]|uniref:glycosyl hydrolase 115 family protein n=1 Tax=Cytophaga sp. FL35 TaxID=1904456 RepID=UPI001653C463|nr:glycosyl hydrolase 115 family protein [Cytophaga sp. FL35]MBC6998575.1 glycosyl hydrolase 115 family protein [Cytophaga sp. FL35]